MDINNKKINSAQHAFFYLTSFFALAFVAFAVGGLFFQIINFYFPEGFDTYINEFRQSSIKFSIAALIVAAPAFYFLSRIINRSLSKKDLNEDSGVRRWLTYLVMFVTIATVMGDLIATIFSFLDGELTIRFFLKALTILVISGGIFTYYLTDMKNENEGVRKKKNNIWSIGYWVLIIIPFVWSLAIMENPKEARLRKIDTDTERMLGSIRNEVERYYMDEQELPKDLLEMKNPQYNLPKIKEREEKEMTYAPKGNREYELCAFFERDNQEDENSNKGYSYYGYNWDHKNGLHCFDLKIPKPTEVVPTTPF